MTHRILTSVRALGGAYLPLCRPLSRNLTIHQSMESGIVSAQTHWPNWITNRALHTSHKYQGIHEPDYLNPVGPQVAHYELLNIQIKGYDYTTLEEFGKYVHHTAERFNLEVEDAWATPSKHLKILRLKPESTVVDTEYKLQAYERNVQISEVPSTILPLFINIVETTLPSGVSLSIHPHFKEHTQIRYVPDLQLKELRGQLDTFGTERKPKRRH